MSLRNKIPLIEFTFNCFLSAKPLSIWRYNSIMRKKDGTTYGSDLKNPLRTGNGGIQFLWFTLKYWWNV